MEHLRRDLKEAFHRHYTIRSDGWQRIRQEDSDDPPKPWCIRLVVLKFFLKIKWLTGLEMRFLNYTDGTTWIQYIPWRFRWVKGRPASLREIRMLWSPAEVTDGFPDKFKLTTDEHKAKLLMGKFQKVLRVTDAGKYVLVLSSSVFSSCNSRTWPTRLHCCQSTRFLPDSGGSVNSRPVREDKVGLCLDWSAGAGFFTEHELCIRAPVIGLCWGVPGPGNLLDPCEQQTGLDVWDSEEAESSAPAQTLWIPVHCGINTLISGDLCLKDQRC